MVDLASEMAQLWTSLGPQIPDRGRVITFVSATPGEGASTVSREFASFAADRVRRNVWLVDLTIPECGQVRAILDERDRYGSLGREAAASPNGSAFFTVRPAMHGPDGRPWPPGRYLAGHQVDGRRLWVTRFRRELLRQGQSVSLTPGADYWKAMRKHADLVVIDAPAASASPAALMTSAFSDTTVIVVAADKGDMQQAAALRDAVVGAGGRCAGVVVNRAEAPAEPSRLHRAIFP